MLSLKCDHLFLRELCKTYVDFGMLILGCFSKFMKETENWDFLIAWPALSIFSQFPKEFENWDFWSPVRIVFQDNMCIGEGEPIYD